MRNGFISDLFAIFVYSFGHLDLLSRGRVIGDIGGVSTCFYWPFYHLRDIFRINFGDLAHCSRCHYDSTFHHVRLGCIYLLSLYISNRIMRIGYIGRRYIARIITVNQLLGRSISDWLSVNENS